jgi:hypothetical protein
MNKPQRLCAGITLAAVCALGVASRAVAATPPIGGFIPFVGIGLTKEFETFDSDPAGTFFIADPSFSWGSPPLGPGSSAYFDLALLDTGSATHILTQQAASATGFSIQAEGLRGTNFQTIFGASGSLDLRINDPLGVYAAGLADRASAGATLTMNTGQMRGQTSFAMLEAPAEWELPNILGLPIAAHHAIAIRNSEPQLFQHQGRTVRTPNVEFIDLASGADEGIVRRTNLQIRPSAGFLQGPLYVQNLDILGGNFNFHDNPLSPSVVENGAMFLEVDLANGTRSVQDKEFLFDTGVDVTVVSQLTAARLGFDVVLDQPDFVLEVEGAGGVTSGVPGFYLDELNIDTVGGSFTLEHVPVAVLDLPDPNDPANTIDGIVGMHLFNDRNLVIDASPAASPAGVGPRVYISDPVSQTHTWVSPIPQTSFNESTNWSAPGVPNVMWDAELKNNLLPNQFVEVSQNTTVFRLSVGASAGRQLQLQLTGSTLTAYGEVRIEEGGQIFMGGRLDAQVVNIDAGRLFGSGEIFVGAGPVRGVVRNLGGSVDPGAIGAAGQLTIDGDYSQLDGGTLEIDLAGTTPVTQYDRLAVGRNAFLDGTLEVGLLGFTPSVGAAFTILTAGDGVFGQFENLLLPAGFQWNVAYNANNVVLSVLGLGLAGDYNADGVVSAADYVVWRDSMGATGSSLPADGNGDEIVNHDDYLVWRSNFGKTASASGSAIVNLAGVPEPTSFAMGIFAAAVGAGCSSLSRKRLK